MCRRPSLDCRWFICRRNCSPPALRRTNVTLVVWGMWISSSVLDEYLLDLPFSRPLRFHSVHDLNIILARKNKKNSPFCPPTALFVTPRLGCGQMVVRDKIEDEAIIHCKIVFPKAETLTVATSFLRSPMSIRLFTVFLVLSFAAFFCTQSAEAVRGPKITNKVYFDIKHGDKDLGRGTFHCSDPGIVCLTSCCSCYGSLRSGMHLKHSCCFSAPDLASPDRPKDSRKLPRLGNGQVQGWQRPWFWLQGVQVPPCYQELHVGIFDMIASRTVLKNTSRIQGGDFSG